MKSIIHTDMSKITPVQKNEHEQYGYSRYEVTDGNDKCEVVGPGEKNQTVVAFYSIAPGKANYPLHYHTTNEEVFYIISGNGILETVDKKEPIKAGDIIVCAVGSNGAHKIINTSESEALVYLDVDTNVTPDIVYYPHSNKVGIRAKGGIRDNYSIDSKVDYYYKE